MDKSVTIISLGKLIQDFFNKRLLQQRQVSRQTILSYRDTFRLLLGFAEKFLKKSITNLDLSHLDAPLILAFLDYLEADRKNSIRSRNSRLAAIRSFFNYAILQEPSAMPEIKRVLAIPMKRFVKPIVNFLSKAEIEAIINAPDKRTQSGQRDRILWLLLYNTGARVSEILNIRRKDVEVSGFKTLHLTGKGRKERVIPLWKRTTKHLQSWLAQIEVLPQQTIFTNRFGDMMTRSGIEKRLRVSVKIAEKNCPSLKNKRVSPHTIRHTTAMHLLQSGVDLSVIAIWLGHESISTTHTYLQADMAMKEKALAKLQAPDIKNIRYKAPKELLSFLNNL